MPRPDQSTTRSPSDAPSTDVDEREIGGLRVRIDRLLCVGFGDCVESAPGLFRLDDEEIAVFDEGADGVSRDLLLEACESCPVDALSVVDESGDQIVPE